MGWWEDLGAAFEQAAEDVGGWVEQAVEDVGEAVEQAAEDVGEWVDQAVEDVGEWVDQAAEDVGEWVEQAAEDVGEAVEDVAEWTLNTLDDYVFDPVDYITGGVIDIDYDDGQFSAGLDIGIAAVGVSFGEQGFSADASFDVGLASGEISYDSADGLAMSGSLGVDWGPLPYAEGHLTISPDGDVSIGGRLQATLPLPFGEIGGEVSGGFARGSDGSWGAYADAELHADGFFGGVAVDTSTSLDVDPDGDFTFESSLEAEATGPLGARAGFETSTTVELDDDVLSASFDADAEAGILGAEVSGGATLAGTVDDEGMSVSAEGRAGVDAFGRETDGTVRLEHDREFGGTTTDVLTGEVITTGPDGQSTTVGGAVAASHGADGASIEADSWVESNDQAAPEPASASSSEALMGGADPAFDEPPAFEEPPTFQEPAPSDFAVKIETIESVEAEADELWDDLGG